MGFVEQPNAHMRETTVRRRVLMPHFQRETEYGQLYQGHGTFQFAPEVEMTPPTRGRGRPRKAGLTGKSLRPFRMQDSVPTRKRGRPRKTLSIDADRLRRITGVCRCGTLCRPSKDRVQSGSTLKNSWRQTKDAGQRQRRTGANGIRQGSVRKFRGS